MGKFRKLGRHAAHRVSMLRTMVSQLVKHERIETTVAKAKEVRRKADQMVQLGKEGTLDAARRASAFVRGDDVVHKLFTELALRFLWTLLGEGSWILGPVWRAPLEVFVDFAPDSDFARFDRDPHFVPTIPERYNRYAVTSDGSTSEANAATMDVFRDDLATAIALAWN